MKTSAQEKKLDSKTINQRQLNKKINLIKKLIKEYLSPNPDNTLKKDYDKLKTNRSFEKPEKIHPELVFTTYFTSKPNPQNLAEKAPDNDLKYILPWYNSINKLKIQGIIFHDNLSDEFVTKYTTEYVQFVKCKLGGYSLNDERFIIYYMFILENIHEISSVFMTDASDVIIQSSPFSFSKNYHENVLFVGRNNGNLRRQRAYNINKTRILEKEMGEKIEQNFYNMPIYNAGLLGGKTPVIIYFLRQLVNLILKCNSDKNLNMPAFNYIIYLYWYPKVNKPLRRLAGSFFNIDLYERLKDYITTRGVLNKLFFFIYRQKKEHDNKNDNFANTKFIVTSYPFCSAFKKYEQNSDAVFVHK